MAELIVYLEPSKDTPLYQNILTFLKESKEKYYSSTATKYPPHTSITGFFQIKDRAWIPLIMNQYKHDLNEAKKDLFLNETNRPKINIEPLLISKPYSPILHDQQKQKQKQTLLLPIQITPSFHSFFSTCATKINQTILMHQQKELIRIKRIDHISLLYFDEPNATIEEINHWLNWSNGDVNVKRMKEDIFTQLSNLNHHYDFNKNQKWDIVLYERIHKSIIIGEPHQLKELTRWSIY